MPNMPIVTVFDLEYLIDCLENCFNYMSHVRLTLYGVPITLLQLELACIGFTSIIDLFFWWMKYSNQEIDDIDYDD